MATATRGIEQELVERVQELTAQLEQVADPRSRALADELAAAIVQLYGEGLERIFAAARRGRRGRALGRGRRRREPDAHPRPLPGRRSRTRVQRGARQRAPVPGVPRRRRRAARHRGRRRAAAAAGLVQRLRGVGSDARAGDRAARWRRPRPTCSAIDVEGVVAPPPRRAARRPPATPSGSSSTASRAWTRGALAARGDGLVVANVAGTLLAYRDACAGCAAPLTAAMLVGGTLTCAACGAAYDLPRAGRGRDDADLQLEPVPLLRNGGAVRVASRREHRAARSSPRWARRPPPVAPAARGRRRALRAVPDRASARTTATCCTSSSGGSSASARRAGRCARATPSTARPARARCGSTTSTLPDELWAAFQIPIGLAFLMRSSVSGDGRRAVPEPGRRDRVRARAVRVGRAARGQPDARAARARRRGADRQPPRRPPHRYAIVADRPVLPARRADQVALGGHLRRARSTRGRRVLRRAAARARTGARRTASMSAPAEARLHRARLHRARRRAGRARGDADAALPPARRRPARAARSTRSRCRRRSRSTRRGAAYDDATRARLVELFGAPERWARDDAQLPLGARRRARARLHRRDVVRARGAVHLRPRGRGEQVLLLAARRRGPAVVPLHRDGALRAARRDRLQVAQVPWSCTARWRMPVEAWKRAMADLLPRRRLGAAGDRDARRARRAQGRSAAAIASTTCVAGAARGARMTELDELVDDAAVGGLRALPVHAGRDEERDADAVRDRLPAGLRRGQPAHVRPHAAAGDRRGRRAGDAGAERALPRVARRAHEAVARVVELPATQLAQLDGDASARSRSTPCAAARGWRRAVRRGSRA